MEIQNTTNLFENAITMEELEPRLELAATASGNTTVTVVPTANYTTGSPLNYNVTVGVGYSF